MADAPLPPGETGLPIQTKVFGQATAVIYNVVVAR